LRWSLPVYKFYNKRKERNLERLKTGGCYEGEKQRTEGKQEGAAIEPQREKKVEEGEEEQVGWKVSIQVSEVV